MSNITTAITTIPAFTITVPDTLADTPSHLLSDTLAYPASDALPDALPDALSDVLSAEPLDATPTESPDRSAACLFGFPVPFTFGRGVAAVRTAETGPWIVYKLTERATGRVYVGITQRAMTARISAHLSQARRDRGVRANGLMAALQAMEARGDTFTATFDVVIVARAADAGEAAEQERKWITMLACRVPVGFNSMPGGGVGGPANARELSVEVAPRAWRFFSSIYEAIGHRNRELRRAHAPLLDPGVVYARLSAGWSPEEALGYAAHVDGRGRRAAFLVDGQTFGTLREASRVTGMSVDTLRSRHHRQLRRSPASGPLDIGSDRRSGNGSADRESLAIVWPETGERLTAEAFAIRTGVPASTVIHRWHRARAVEAEQVARGEPPLSAAEMADRLRAATDRRKPLDLILPDGRCWTGGERDLIRRVFANTPLKASRLERLSESGIRRRLRLLSDADRQRQDLVWRAFGLAPAGGHGEDPEPGPPSNAASCAGAAIIGGAP